MMVGQAIAAAATFPTRTYYPSRPAGSSPSPKGTATVEVIPYTEPSYRDTEGRILDQYQAISAQAECADLSLDELRLADYEQGYGTASVNTSKSVETTTPLSLQRLPRSDDRKQNSHVDLLRGPGMEIRIGTGHDLALDSMCNTWSLPKRLISYYSPFLKAACLRDFKERRENQIELPNDDPVVFALFVEWIYYRDYAIAPFSLPSRIRNSGTSVDAEC
ncbi:hypothetical protein HBI73_135200 [Parastagonospora nodorum]|nr:hypothetical protein HBH51_230140 [Parastagonospora nodorum]KAH4185812.1 hypothetical protein HBH42_177060 [Parastagonospora nodorum]KAH5088628.1 hypothetical protein HBI73_135200 [Parastagonospora nodorum]KAH5207136.1 hypothetical protein HBI62_237360 [Parastagonospora nodorum]KAH5596440.1 hypothetical protein HBI45_182860 [Parastagonospora nodorum]